MSDNNGYLFVTVNRISNHNKCSTDTPTDALTNSPTDVSRYVSILAITDTPRDALTYALTDELTDTLTNAGQALNRYPNRGPDRCPETHI